MTSSLSALAGPLLEGLGVTIMLTAGGVLVGVAAAFAAGMARLSAHRPMRWMAAAYVESFRGTSSLVQLFWAYFALPLFGIEMSATTAGIAVLGLNAGAYGAEVVRGAVLAVPRDQWEAACALGFTRVQTLRRIVLPQALPAMLPPAGNLAIELMKNTALVSLIAVTDLTFAAQLLRSATLESGRVFALVLVLYFAFALCITAGVRLLERRVRGRAVA